MKKGISVRKITVCAVLSALSAILMFLSIPLPFLPPYLKLDFGDLPALIGAFSMGPVWGVVICLIKNILSLLNTATAGVGELANFINGAAFVFFAGLVYEKRKSKKGALIGALLGTVMMCAVGFFVNLYITYPFYEKAMMPMEVIVRMYEKILPWADTLIKGLLVFNLPFSFARGILLSFITMLIYKRISPIIKGR